jgi:hypothetical protein
MISDSTAQIPGSPRHDCHAIKGHPFTAVFIKPSDGMAPE